MWYVIVTAPSGLAQAACSTFQDAHAPGLRGITRSSVWSTTSFGV
jgi:hypothetical protein